MNSDDSVTHWISQLNDGNSVAAQRLWERYFSKLVRMARNRLNTANRRVSDEEDVAVSVFDKFVRASQAGQIPDLADRDALWRLLVQMTAQKATDHIGHHRRLRRGGGNVSGESVFGKLGGMSKEQALAQVVGSEPTPEFTIMLTEQFERLLAIIGEPELQELAVGKMEGFSNAEMAEQLNCSVRTIERRLRYIRVKCRDEMEQDIQ